MSALVDLMIFDGSGVEADRVARWKAALSPEERTRSDRLVREEARRRFVISHYVLRALLAERVGVRPEALRFETGPYGKPRLADGGPEFSLSHSADLSAIAVSQQPLGVDIEAARSVEHLDRMIAFTCGDEEAATVRRKEDASRNALFLDVWVRKEAILKLLGAGLRCDIRSLDVIGTEGFRQKVARPGGGSPIWVIGDAERDCRWALATDKAADGVIARRLLAADIAN